MEFSGIKAAVIDYSKEIEQNTKSVRNHFVGISNALNDLTAMEDKWTDSVGDIEASINAIPDDSVKALYLGQLTMLRTQRAGLIAMLTALETAVTDAGLMLI